MSRLFLSRNMDEKLRVETPGGKALTVPEELGTQQSGGGSPAEAEAPVRAQLFSLLEGCSAAECLERCAAVIAANPPSAMPTSRYM